MSFNTQTVDRNEQRDSVTQQHFAEKRAARPDDSRMNDRIFHDPDQPDRKITLVGMHVIYMCVYLIAIKYNFREICYYLRQEET